MIGYDWVGAAFTFFGTFALMSKKFYTRAFGFALGMVSNVFWFLFGFQINSDAVMYCSALFMVVNTLGMARNILYGKENL